jgi:Uma2 family endonuclease
MSLRVFSCSEPITEPEILESIRALPTEDDLPCDDGEPMETPRHREQMHVLIDSLTLYWAERQRYYVGGNMFLHFDPTNRRRTRGPDFFLALDVEERDRRSWVVWQEGMRFPDLIIELLSDSTRDIDKGEKKEIYEQVFRTQEYYLYDPFSQEFTGYHLQGVRYHEVTADAEQKIYSAVTGLYLGIRAGWLRWVTADDMVVPTPREWAEQERQRAEQERQRAEQEYQRAEQEYQRAEQERQRAEQEYQHAEQERQHAEQEHQRAERAEQLLEAYRQRFGSLEDL